MSIIRLYSTWMTLTTRPLTFFVFYFFILYIYTLCSLALPFSHMLHILCLLLFCTRFHSIPYPPFSHFPTLRPTTSRESRINPKYDAWKPSITYCFSKTLYCDNCHLDVNNVLFCLTLILRANRLCEPGLKICVKWFYHPTTWNPLSSSVSSLHLRTSLLLSI